MINLDLIHLQRDLKTFISKKSKKELKSINKKKLKVINSFVKKINLNHKMFIFFFNK